LYVCMDGWMDGWMRGHHAWAIAGGTPIAP